MFLYLFTIFLVTGLAASDPVKEPPKWSVVYTVKGILSIPYAELKEPFYAWYDKPHGVSRIDYYGGMVKTYQLTGASGAGQYGSSLKVAPVTTETELNKPTCLQVNGSSESQVDVQSILPDLEGFQFAGTETIRGEETEKWRLSQKFGEKTNKYTIWIKYRKPSGSISDSLPIPVRYEMRGFNSLLGSHYDHYYLDYEDYDVDDIPNDVFAVDDSKCIGFPGPGDKHRYTLNPMMEFVHPTVTEHVEEEFHRFNKKHKKNYLSNLEHTQRKEIFRQNLRYIHSQNRANRGYSLVVNHLADRSEAERQSLRGKQFTVRDNGAAAFPYRDARAGVTVPPSWDWRIQGAVTPVKDQSVCGSCWSFGSIGSVEGALFLHNGNHLQRLSSQAVIDCSWGYGNNGCDGGEDWRAYQWIMKHGGIPLEEEYGGYLGQDGYCHIDSVQLLAPIKGYVNVTANDRDALRLAIFKHGPISVSIDASHKTFSFYSHGVYYEPKCKNDIEGLDHSVLAVGYGTLNGEDYWLIKNSWSNYWGNDGYILMSAKNNNCGVETVPTYVTM